MEEQGDRLVGCDAIRLSSLLPFGGLGRIILLDSRHIADEQIDPHKLVRS